MPEYTPKNNPAYWVRGNGVQNKASAFKMGPRYWEKHGPLDDTTVLALYPMHSASSDSTLLERDDFERLAGWLHSAHMGDVWTNASSQNTMTAERLPDASVHFKAFWNSTPGHTSGSFRMATSQVLDLMAWMDDKLVNGWAGWKSGAKREELKVVSPSKADWALNMVIDRGTDYLADGDDMVFLTGPEDMEYAEWREYVDRYADGCHVVEFCATPVSQGRWWKTGTKAMFKTSAKGY
jgi:hypothetical protein